MKTRTGITGSTLKWAAIILMAIDHIGAGILENFVLNIWGRSPMGYHFAEQWETIFAVDGVLRMIGRPAFPIFCFLLVEGFCHTHDVKKYAVRLGIFALVSEIPFDLALWNQVPHWQYQNVFFTLLIGLLAMLAVRRYGTNTALKVLILAAGAVLAEFLHTDYGAFGVLFIGILYLLRDNRKWQCIVGAACCLWELTAPLAFLLIWRYNGERGRQPRWLFYWFYPAHLLLYYVIGAWILPAVLGIG